MAKRTKPQTPPPTVAVRGRIWLLSIGFFLVQVLIIPGAASPFRLPKTAVALTFIVVIAGLSFAGQIAHRRLTLKWSPLAALLVSLPLLQTLSALWSSSPRLAIVGALHSTVWILGIVWIATTTDAERRRLVYATALGAAISGIVLIIQATGHTILTLDETNPIGRLGLTGLTGNPADLAMAAVLLLPLLLATPGRSSRPWLRWALAILLTLAAFVSQTLTGLAALGLVWTVWLFQQRSRRLWIGAVATAVLFVIIALATGLDSRLHRQLWRLEHGDWYFLLSARNDGWTAATELIRSRPLIGNGASNFTHAYYPSRVAWLERTGTVGRRAEMATHFDLAHCDPLQMFAELGVPGVIWMIALVVIMVRIRPRGDPLPLLTAAAFSPFLLLHFPTHLAVGLVPLTLVLAEALRPAPEVVIEPGSRSRNLVVVLMVLLVAGGVYWQFQRTIINMWRGGLSDALASAQSIEGPQRAQQAAAVEAQILPRIPALPAARPWLWRMVGQARLARGEDVGAETAFRAAMTLWQHEEAEFGLGLALASQGRRIDGANDSLDIRNRRGEAILHLARVCRTNPALLDLIAESDLRRSVGEIVAALEQE